MLYVQSSTPVGGRKNRPKHIELYSINLKIVHLVGFTTEIYDDARSHERQICNNQVHAAHTLFPSSVSVFFSNLCLPSIRTPYYITVQKLPIHNVYLIPNNNCISGIASMSSAASGGGKNGRRSPTPHPASFSVFTHIFLNFIPVFWRGYLKIQQNKRQKIFN